MARCWPAAPCRTGFGFRRHQSFAYRPATPRLVVSLFSPMWLCLSLCFARLLMPTKHRCHTKSSSGSVAAFAPALAIRASNSTKGSRGTAESTSSTTAAPTASAALALTTMRQAGRQMISSDSDSAGQSNFFTTTSSEALLVDCCWLSFGPLV